MNALKNNAFVSINICRSPVVQNELLQQNSKPTFKKNHIKRILNSSLHDLNLSKICITRAVISDFEVKFSILFYNNNFYFLYRRKYFLSIIGSNFKAPEN